MLSELKMVGEWFLKEPDSAWNFEEIRFDTEMQEILSSLSQPNRQITVSDHSAKVVLCGKSDNHCYIPGQYFLYALKLRPLLMLLNSYQKVLTALGNEVNSESKKHTIRVLRARDKSSPAISKLDGYSQEQFFSIFNENPDARLGAKALIKNDTEHRPLTDFFGSILLAAIPVPNASSGTLADLLLSISENEVVSRLLQEKYSHAIPWLFRSADGDELMFQVVSTLGWEGKLDHLPDAEPVGWGDIDDAFLVRPTPEPSNNHYFTTPVHYLESCKKYVFVRKGLLDTAKLAVISAMVADAWPSMCIRFRDGTFFVESQKSRKIFGPTITGGTNRIFYGAPGTGKSHRVHHAISADADKFVTVFHPDTLHTDFVGALKPITERNNEVVYRFRAGPFTNALVHALLNPDRKVSLIIEEINRASAAAVFGELFQLLDRNPDGESTYSIDATDPDMLGYINNELGKGGCAPLDALQIPANLSLLATMNSSDQAVMPLDTAFKRRWHFEYLPIDFVTPGIPQTLITLPVDSGTVAVKWPDLARIINAALVECDVAEDRLVGPFFLSAKELESEEKARSALGGKLFIYLWDDVLRHHGHDRIFSSTYKTFGDLSAAFAHNKPVFSLAIEERLAKVSDLVSGSGTPQDVAD